MSSKPAVGKLTTIVPGVSIPMHDKATMDEIVASLVRLAGRGVVRARDKRTKVEATFNAMVHETNPASMSIKVKDFFAFTDGYVLGNRKLQDLFVKTLTVAPAHATLERKDIVVLEPEEDANKAKCNQGGKISIIQGIPGSGAPSPTDSDQILLACITVRPASTSILASDIDNTVKEFIKDQTEIVELIDQKIDDAMSSSIIVAMQAALAQLQIDVAALQVGGPGVAALQAEVDALEASLLMLSSQVSTSASDIGSLSAQLTSVLATLATLQASMTSLAAQAANIPALQASVALLQSDVAALSGIITTMQSQLAALSSQTAMNGSDIMALQAAIISINSTMSLIFGDIAALQTQDAGILATLATMTSQLNTMTTNFNGLNSVVASLVSDVALNTASISSLQSQVASIQAAISALTADSTAIQADVASLYSLVTAAEEWNQGANGDLKQYIDNADALILSQLSLQGADVATVLAYTNNLLARMAAVESKVGNYGDELFQGYGTQGSGNGNFNNPAGVSLSADKAYVADSFNHRIIQRDFQGAYVAQSGSFGTGNGQFNTPVGLAVSPDGSKLAVCDSMNHRVQLLDLPGMTFSASTGSFGTGNGQFNQPHDVEWTPDGLFFYVTDRMNHRVQKFNAAGVYQSQFGGNGSGNGQFKEPFGIGVQSDGSVIVVDSQNHRVQKFDNAGAFVSLVGLPASFSQDLSVWGSPANALFGSAAGSDLLLAPNGTLFCFGQPNYYSKSLDGGLTFGGAQALPGAGGFASSACVGNAGRILVAESVGEAQLAMQYSDNNGTSWSAVTAIGLASSATGNVQKEPSMIKLANGHIMCAFVHRTNGHNQIGIVKSTDNGATWSAGSFVQVPDWGGDTHSPKLMEAANGDLIIASLGAGYMWFNKSVNGGGTWSSVTYHPMFPVSQMTATKLSNDTLLLLTMQNSGSAYYITSSDNGATWSTEALAHTGITMNGQKNGLLQMPNGDILFGVYNSSAVHTQLLRNSSVVVGGSADGKFNSPKDVAIGPSDQIYVIDSINDRYQVFDSSGAFLRKAGTGGSGSGQFQDPTGIEVDDSNGATWIGDSGNHRLVKAVNVPSLIGKMNEVIAAINLADTLTIAKL